MSDEFFSTSEARKVLSDLVNQVKYSGREFFIGRHGKVEAKLVPVETVDERVDGSAGMETDDVQGLKTEDKPDFQEHIKNQTAMRNETMKYDSRALKYEYAKLAKKYDLKLMVLFGSHAKGNVCPDSDVDIAVVPKKELSNNDEQMLHFDLVKLLDCDDINISNLEQIYDVRIRYKVVVSGKVLYEEKSNLFGKYRMSWWHEYQDFKHYFDRFDRLQKAKRKKSKRDKNK